MAGVYALKMILNCIKSYVSRGQHMV